MPHKFIVVRSAVKAKEKKSGESLRVDTLQLHPTAIQTGIADA
jgi:hypothetical protein